MLGSFHMTVSPTGNSATDELIGTGPQTEHEGRGRLGQRHAAARRPAGRLAGQRPGLLRRPAAGRAAEGQRPWPVHRRFRRCLLVPNCPAEPLPDPTDGPVGSLLAATKRHPYRPAHIHFIATAPGHSPLTTHIFVAGSDYIESDAVFAVKRSLIEDFILVDDPAEAARYGLTAPFHLATFNIVLQPAA